MEQLKYNYVLFCNPLGADRLFLESTHQDIIKRDDVKLFMGATDGLSNICKHLHRLHFSAKLNRFFQLPRKNIWNSLYYQSSFNNDRPICFIFERTQDRIFSQTEYYSFLRSKFPGCKLVLMIRDRVEGTSAPYFQNERERIEKSFDKILVYSLYDAKAFGYTYFPSYESKVCAKPDLVTEQYDLFYAGEGKDRVKILQNICLLANKKGLRCFFFLYNVKEAEKIPMDGIVYSNQWMPFDRLLAYANKSKCLVDIIQGEAAGFTSRFWHAIFYDKYLISNNPIIQFTKFYEPRYMQLIEQADEIDFSVLESGLCPNYTYNNEFSSLNFIGFVDQLLEKNVSSEEYYGDWFDIETYRRTLDL